MNVDQDGRLALKITFYLHIFYVSFVGLFFSTQILNYYHINVITYNFIYNNMFVKLFKFKKLIFVYCLSILGFKHQVSNCNGRGISEIFVKKVKIKPIIKKDY